MMQVERWQDDGPGWHRADAIVRRVQEPVIPDLDVLVEDHGAVADGATDCSAAIAAAIEHARQAGGGRVVLGAGIYRTGPIRLYSKIDLHIAAGSTVQFIPEPERYLPPVLTRWQGVEMMGYSPLITAHDAEDVAVTGSGTLDGGADNEHWWPWCGLAEFGWHEGIVEQERDWQHLMELARDGVPVAERVMAPARNFRPNFIEFYRCSRVMVQRVHLVRSPMWEIHPVLCTGVLIEDVQIDSHGPNNDGVDPECCTDVVIRGCRFNVGDDAIAIKAGREEDAERVDRPCRNIVIEDCTMTMKYGAFTIGSELTSGVSDVYVRRCTIGGDLWYGLYIKTNAARGGYVENVYIDDVVASQLHREFLSCNFLRGEGLLGPRVPTVRHIRITNVRVGSAKRALHLVGFGHSPIADVVISASSFESMAEPDLIENVVGISLTTISPDLESQRREVTTWPRSTPWSATSTVGRS